ncbi:MAG: hypothetical protein PHV25_01710 [Candidatus Pacebacteria bacterium]|nr:hypothetical protein [Candidatus Paceibacterota bacterium]
MEKLPNREYLDKKEIRERLLEKIDSFVVGIEPEIIERLNNYDSSITIDHIRNNIKDSFLNDINLILPIKEKTIEKIANDIEKNIESKNFVLDLKDKISNLDKEEFDQIEEEGNEYLVAYLYSLGLKNKDCSFEELKSLLTVSFNRSILDYEKIIKKLDIIKNQMEQSDSAYFLDLLIKKLDDNLNKTEKIIVSLMGHERHGLSYGTYNPITNNIETPLLNHHNSKQLKATIMHEITHIMLANLFGRPKRNFISRSLKAKFYPEEKRSAELDMVIFAIDESLAYCIQERYEKEATTPPYDGYQFVDPLIFKNFFETIKDYTSDMNMQEFDKFSKEVYLYLSNQKGEVNEVVDLTISYIKEYNVNSS